MTEFIALRVLLQGINTPSGVCETGDLRLELATETKMNNSIQGRLELCINNAWGTICDNLFGAEDAEVACSRLTGFSRQGNVQSFVHAHIFMH